MTTDTNKAKVLQKKILAWCGIVVLVVLVFTWLIGGENALPKPKEGDSEIHDISKDVSDEHYWMWDYAGRVKQHDQQLTDLQHKIDAPKEDENLSKFIEQTKQENEALRERLLRLENQATGSPTQWTRPTKPEQSTSGEEKAKLPNSEDTESFMDDLPAYDPTGENKGQAANNQNDDLTEHSFQTYNFKLVPIGDNNAKDNIKDTIPSNSFIKAVLLNGVDISAGEASQQNPQPVILRVTGWGNLPNGHKLRGLKQCRIHAVAWGDLSSERVYLQPDLLTCVNNNGDIIETSVEGHVAAQDGKLGIRGHMVTRDADLIRSATLAGTLSGLGETAASTQGTTSISPLGSTQTFNGKQALTSSLGKGIGKGLEMVASYKIKQAERLQPIIQVSGGLEVEVLFFTSSKIGKTIHKAVVEKETTHDQEVLDTINDINQKFGEKSK